MKHPITHNTLRVNQHQAGSKKTVQSLNLLNLPTSINFYSENKQIDYIYTASGQKTEQKTIDNERVENRRQYARSFVFKNRQLSYAASIVGRFLYVDDGRENTEFKNEYSLKDHTSVSLSTGLGNTRVTLDHGGNSVQHIDYYPFGHMIYESDTETPFAEDNRYLYNGKELQDDFGVDWYDYGARFYHPQIARWHSVDPLAEDYYPISPYAYVANNPIIFIDPDGQRIVIANNTSKALTNLAMIAATSKGRQRLDRLISSRHTYTARSTFWSSSSAYDGSGEIGRSRTVYYVGSAWRPSVGGGAMSSMYAMGHEFKPRI